MKPDLNHPDNPATKGDLNKLEQKLEKTMEHIASEQANVILEAVDERMDKNMERMEKKLDEKFDPVVTKLDGILKGVEALQQENTIGAAQLRRHEDRITKLEASARRA